MVDDLFRPADEVRRFEPGGAAAAAREFAIRAHGIRRYGAQPYVVHLDEVAAHLQPYGEEAVIIGYLHDVVEDTDVPLGEIWLRFGSRVALGVLLVSDEKPAPRGERKQWVNAKLAAAGPNEHIALVVKTADRLANVSACIRDGDIARLNQYRGEHPSFRYAAYRAALCEPLWQRLDQLLQAGDLGSVTRHVR